MTSTTGQRLRQLSTQLLEIADQHQSPDLLKIAHELLTLESTLGRRTLERANAIHLLEIALLSLREDSPADESNKDL